jgi:hypothetical protein
MVRKCFARLGFEESLADAHAPPLGIGSGNLVLLARDQSGPSRTGDSRTLGES